MRHDAGAAEVRERGEAGKEGKPIPDGTFLSWPQPHGEMQPVAWAQLDHSALEHSCPGRKGEKVSAALFPGSLVKVGPTESPDSCKDRL